MAVLPGVLGCRTLRRTVQVRLGSNPLRVPGGTPIFTVLRHRFVYNAGWPALFMAVPEIGKLNNRYSLYHNCRKPCYSKKILLWSFLSSLTRLDKVGICSLCISEAVTVEPGYFMNYLLRPRIWPSFLASSGVGPCDVPFRYASEPTPCGCQVASPSSWSRDSNS